MFNLQMFYDQFVCLNNILHYQNMHTHLSQHKCAGIIHYTFGTILTVIVNVTEMFFTHLHCKFLQTLTGLSSDNNNNNNNTNNNNSP
jgi:hypothetical protein